MTHFAKANHRNAHPGGTTFTVSFKGESRASVVKDEGNVGDKRRSMNILDAVMSMKAKRASKESTHDEKPRLIELKLDSPAIQERGHENNCPERTRLIRLRSGIFDCLRCGTDLARR